MIGTGSPFGHRYWPFRFWPIEAEHPGGLNLILQPDELGNERAVDLANVDFDRQGSVRARDGSSLFATPTASTSVARMRPFYSAAGDQLMAHYLVAGGTSVTAFSNAGAVVATKAMASSSSVCDFAPVGTPAAARCYVSDSFGVMQRWDGSAYTAVTGSPHCSYVCTSPIDNRLIAANVSAIPTGSGATASSSLVHFSDPGAPEAWGANNYIYLTPGDGEPIMAIIAWRELVFVFKRTKFFTFYSTTTDSTGNPIFNYRTVDAHVGVQNPFAACSSPDGVYFCAADGVYLTNGHTPKRITEVVDPFWRGNFTPYWTGGSTTSKVWGDGSNASDPWGDGTDASNRWGDGAAADMRLCYANGRLYIFRTNNTDMLVWDTIVKAWTYWAFPAANGAMTAMQLGGAGPEIVMLGQPTTIAKLDQNVATDQGAAVNAHYRSGIYAPFGFTTVQVHIRETILEGQGTVQVSVSRDWALGMPTNGGGAKQTVTLGSAPVSGRGRHRVAQRGGRFSIQVEGVAPWQVDTLAHHVTSPRPPGIETSSSTDA